MGGSEVVTENGSQRKLAAILSADAVGYSRLMGDDEAATVAALDGARAVFREVIAAHRGRVVDTAGDSVLAVFDSVVESVAGAVEIQDRLAEENAALAEDRRMRFRIGINLGDVIAKADGTIYGDGVNIAARLESLAEPGGVTLSEDAYRQVRNKLELAFEDLGEHVVKNISEPVRAYRVKTQADIAPAESPEAGAAMMARPALAVLPFNNMSGDAEQDYFADGLTEDLITALSLNRTFPVIARNSTFVYKGKSTDIRQVAKELGARYVLEGSVRKAANRVRINAQLIDAETGHHIWADKFDRELEDIFELQDEITAHIAATIEPELHRAEQKRALAKKPANLEAWDYAQRGMAELAAFTADGNIRAREMFARAIALDPNYAHAHAGLSFSHNRDMLLQFTDDRETSAARAVQSARRAVALDDNDSFAHLMLAIAYMWPGKFDLAIAEAESAARLNPNSAFARAVLGTALDNAGRSAEGLAHIETSLRLNPRDPQNHIHLNILARAYLNTRNYEAAAEWSRKAIEHRSDYPHAHYLLASSLGHLGRLDEARAALSECERIQSGFTERRLTWQPYKDPADNEHIHDGVRKARAPG